MAYYNPSTGKTEVESYREFVNTPSGVLAGVIDQFYYTKGVYHTTRFLVDRNGKYSFECSQFETKAQATKWILGHTRTPQQERS